MSNPAYIVSDRSATVIHEGQPYTLDSSHPNFPSFKKALFAGDFEEAFNLLDIKKTVHNFSDGELSVIDGEVYYHNTKLHGVVVDKLLDLLADGMSTSAPFIKFIKNLLANPSKGSVDSLYDFLSYKALPIDDDGYVLAYKGVADDYWSKSGNTHTTVIQGQVNERGQILNSIGSTIEVLRRCVSDDRNVGCADGLHVGSFDYARDWSSGGKLLLVRFNPADAVSVPFDCECQKLRVCKYEVLSEIDYQKNSEIEKPYYSVYTDGNQEEVTLTVNGEEVTEFSYDVYEDEDEDEDEYEDYR